MAVATTTPTENKPRRLLLVSVPRTASNLLVKVLNIQRQPNALSNGKGGYFFHHAFMVATREALFKKPIEEWSDREKTEIRDAYQLCLDQLEERCAQAQRDNKIMFTKEHGFWFINPATMYSQRLGPERLEPVKVEGDLAEFFRLRLPDAVGPERTYSADNWTLFPDEYLRMWRLTFIIRHPALAWPSLYRALLKVAKLGAVDDDGLKGASAANMTLTWTRKLYDWSMTQQPDTPPLIIDANDVIHNPDSVLRFCEAAGLDKNFVQFEWGGENDKNPTDGWDNPGMPIDRQVAEIMLSTLEASKGLVKDKAPTKVDIKVEAEKWKDEFGDDVAGVIEKAVWDAMPDYEYLWARRVQT
ncbi:hypothetical protein MMYC01_200850 [Madurella mycetomatis]|uniref:Uncharacterized protein n=1 Tax=Madurella mycetomatis TaxID=100816 RepID=A0A175WGQ8_9PEZI|nr:hypothetical protein MMYC01_200850 [Madurella mycetomatis]